MGVLEQRDVFAEIRADLARSGADPFSVHQGMLYDNPQLMQLMASSPSLLIAPEAHSAYGGEVELRRNIARHLLRDSYRSDEIALCNGGTHGLHLSLTIAMRGGGRRVHALSPYWLYLAGVVDSAGGELDELSTLSAGASVDGRRLLDDLDACQDSKSACVYAAIPSNPVGDILDESFVAELASLCEQRDTLLILDHAYYGFDDRSDDSSGIAALPAVYEHPHIVNVFTFSKLYGVPGARLGFVHGDPDLIAQVERLYRYTNYTANSFSQSVVYRLLEDDEILAQRRLRYRTNLAIAQARLAPICQVPHGGFFAFVRTGGAAGLEALRARGVGLVPGSSFGAGYADYGRFCFTAEPPDRLSRCCDILLQELG